MQQPKLPRTAMPMYKRNCRICTVNWLLWIASLKTPAKPYRCLYPRPRLLSASEAAHTVIHGSLTDAANSFFNYAAGFGSVFGYSTRGGNDTARLFDTTSHDQFVGNADQSYVRSNSGSYLGLASGFGLVQAFASSGSDRIDFFDSQESDELIASGESLTMRSNHYEVQASGFDAATARSTSGGNDSLDQTAVDYIFEALGGWA